MSIRVVIADKLGDAGIALLASSPEIHVVNLAGRPPEELAQALTTATALIVRSETRVTAAMIDAAPHLKVVARAGIGVDTIDVPAATRRGIAVMNAPGANTVRGEEHATALRLSLRRYERGGAVGMREV